MVESGRGEPRLPLGEDLVVGHVHARGAADTEGSSLSPRIKRRIRAKTSLAEIERKERGRTNLPGPPRLRTLISDAAEVPISEGSLVPASTPRSGPQRAHPYTPVGDAVGSSSFEMVPPVRARAASDRGFDESVDTIPITRANSSPSIIQVPTQKRTVSTRTCPLPKTSDFAYLSSCIRVGANTHAACSDAPSKSIRRKGAKVRTPISKIIPWNICPVAARARIHAPHAFTQTSIPQTSFSACIGIVPGDYVLVLPD